MATTPSKTSPAKKAPAAKASTTTAVKKPATPRNKPSVPAADANAKIVKQALKKAKVTDPLKDLSIVAQHFLADLPEELHPVSTMLQYPRIVNRIAEIHQKEEELKAEFKSLLEDKRGIRTGFPIDVYLEIQALNTWLFDDNVPNVADWKKKVGLQG